MSHRLVVDPEEVEVADERAKKKAVEAGSRLKAFWDEDVFPTIQRHIQFWDEFGLASASISELMQHIEESWDRLNELWELHFRLGSASWQTADVFNELYKELFEEEQTETKRDPFQRLKLTQGFPCKTKEMGSALWKLSEGAEVVVQDLLKTSEPHKARGALTSSEAGRDFLRELSGFLEHYGHRGRHWGIEHPTWIEDPTPVFETLKGYLANPDHQPDRHFKTQAAERGKAVAKIRERLSGYPESVRSRFEELLDIVQFGSVLKEDHNFWIDFSCTSRVRRVMREAGRRLVSFDAIDTVDDVFHLHTTECIHSLKNPNSCNPRQQIAERRAEIEHFANIAPPPRLGVEPPKPKDEPDKPQLPDEPGLMKGQPGAPGRVRGTARIVENPSAATQVEAGDIVIAGATAPSFTPVFAIASGIVTESGLLSHCAIVAREYRIPAVVGVKNGRTLISDGQLIEIDGTEGTAALSKTEAPQSSPRT